jgi:hypothetical protein
VIAAKSLVYVHSTSQNVVVVRADDVPVNRKDIQHSSVQERGSIVIYPTVIRCIVQPSIASLEESHL